MSIRLRVAVGVLASAAGIGFGAWDAPARAPVEDATQRELRSIERALERDESRQKSLEAQSEKLAREAQELRTDMIATAKRVQQHEESVTKLEGEVKALNRQERTAKDNLLRRRGQMIGTLSALQRLASRPPEAMLAMPGSPVDTLRSALLLRAAVPPLEREADSLRGRIDELVRVRKETAQKRDRLGKALADLRSERGRLAKLAERKELLRDRAEAESRDVSARVDNMAQEAKDLRDLLARVEAERRAAEEARRRAQEEARRRAAEAARLAAEQAARARADAERARAGDTEAIEAERRRTAALNLDSARRSEAEPVIAAPPPLAEPRFEAKPAAVQSFSGRSAIILPARGRMVTSYGEGQGGRNRGLTIETRPGAQVVAPHDGQIAYAGPFRGYGQVLIIDHGDGYHSLLTGLSKIDGSSGQWVLTGEPVGAMANAEDGAPSLYMELRHRGQPINPLPMMAAQRG